MNEQAGSRVEGQEMPVAQLSVKCCKNTQTNHITPLSYSSVSLAPSLLSSTVQCKCLHSMKKTTKGAYTASNVFEGVAVAQ